MKNTFSIVLETENLGMAGLADLKASLDSLKMQDLSIDNVNEILILVGSHVSQNVQNKLKDEYPWLKIHIEKEELDYAKSKVRGAEIATGNIVIFADSDMRYQKTWLKNMIKAFVTNPEADIISGDTRLETNSIYSMSLNLTWMVQLLPNDMKCPTETSFFPLNNFAIRKRVMLETPVPYTLPLYRNKIPIWEKMLIQKGCRILKAPGTRGYHAPPGGFVDWLYRMLIYGSDFVALADFYVTDDGKVVEKNNFSKRFFNSLFLFVWKSEQILVNTIKLLREDIKNIIYLPGALFLSLINIFVMEVGALVACFNRNYFFNIVTKRELGHVV